MSVSSFTKTGTKATAVTLPKEVFEVEIKSHELIKQAYNTYLSNSRVATATTKKRGEVSGGGRKPWKQKGTGRARVGSSRSPIWRGGGITFGPSGNENYIKQLSQKAKQTAIRQALSLANKAGKISVVESIEAKDGKTKAVAELLDKIEANRRILIVDAQPSVELRRATNNLASAELYSAVYLNVYVIMNADTIVMTKAAVDEVANWLGGKK